LQGNQPLALGSRDAAWVLDSGSAAVFAVDFENGQPKGARRYLFTVKSGDVLVGMSGAQGGRHQELIAIPVEATQVSPVRLNEPAVTTWVGTLATILAALRPPDAATSLPADGPIHIEPGHQAMSDDGATWLRTVHGSVRLLGYAEGKIDRPGACFVMGAGMWIDAEESAELERVVPGDRAAEALAFLEALFFRALGDLERQRIEEERSRFRLRQELNRRLASQTIQDLAAITLPESLALELSPEPPLLAAARIVGQAEGIAIRVPAQSSYQRNPLRAIALSSGTRTRRVILAGRWWEDEHSSLLAYRAENKQPVALIQVGRKSRRRRGYLLVDPATGTRTPLDAATASSLLPVAFSFYRPFGADLSAWALLKSSTEFCRRDFFMLFFCGVAVILLGMAAPQASSLLFSQVIPDGDRRLLWQVAIGLTAALLGGMLFDFTQSIGMLRLQTSMSVSLQTGLWDRLLKLSPAFFRRFTVGDLRSRVEGVSRIQQLLTLETLRTILNGLFSSLNLFLMLYYSVPLGLVALAAGVVVVCATALASRALSELEGTQQQLDGDLAGLMVQLINGVSKLRVAGAEPRAYAHWGKAYALKQKIAVRIRAVHDRMHVINMTVPLLATGLSFWFAFGGAPSAGSLPVGTFIAFNLALGVFMIGITNLSDAFTGLVRIRSIWERTRSILDATPEVDEGKSHPGALNGRIVLDHVSFRYRKDGPLTLEDVCISAEPGECIALVGPSGSGKSTILNLLLRFESPASGAVYFDGQELSGLDIAAVRRQLGVVNQDSKLMSQSIFENIVCGGLSTMADAWDAARAAGLAEDIEQMPMGMHTIVSEGGSNLSGGQRQRIMIARALVMKPSILIFDEATSALDNRTQRIVTESLNKLKVTRFIVAHRLSTIRSADKIYVIENGRVVQRGNYDQLAKATGLFARLMQRQMA
jgi:NHLM bacteriocin system ABC transporter ATP-binding protein